MKKHTKQPRRSSFTIKLFLSMVGCMVLMLCCCWMLNTLALEKYYRMEKEKEIVVLYGQIDEIYDQYSDRTQRRIAIDSINARTNCSIVLINERLQPEYASLGGMEIQNGHQLEITVSMALLQQFRDQQPGSYQVGTEANPQTGRQYITLSGRLSSGTMCILRTPLEAIAESVAIGNRFLIYSGIGAIVLCCVLVFFLARGFTRPIKELLTVTDGIARLDFSRKYTGRSHDEVGALGESINNVSTELERKLSELKTANAQLERDNEIKTRQDQLRRDFIANASHELKTPIALIRAYAEGIREEVSGDPESRRYYCEIIEDEADKMNQLIRKMTSLMQLESGEEELNISRFEITGLIGGILKKYSILLDQKRITVDFRTRGELYCWGDEYFIENVINNYVSNAANHVSARGDITVTAEETMRDGHPRVRVSVFNTGACIGEEERVRIWESFYKADKARTRAYGGTGLGLSVVAAIMRAHNMPYGVENRADGPMFWFELEQG
ncbi:MAG: HAMP domain-containing protein [Clostridia bacterium]|nr:HAMP domain-containing protein [Clostridia bacterium]